MTHVCGMASNRHIDELVINSFLSGGALHIEESFAFAALSKYVNELELLRSGVPFANLGIGKSRAASKPFHIRMDGSPMNLPTDTTADTEEMTPSNLCIIPIRGVMTMQGGMSANGIENVINCMKDCQTDNHIGGIIFDVDTGGGEAMAGEELMYANDSFTKVKPAIAHFRTMGSAGVMGMLPCNEIIAKTDRSKCGSIGTYRSIDKAFLAWYKANIIDIYADKSPNKNKEFNQMKEGDFSGVQAMVNKINENFLADVQKYRPLSGDVENTLSGGMFDTTEAKKRGLVDGMGDLAYAIKRIQYHQKNNY